MQAYLDLWKRALFSSLKLVLQHEYCSPVWNPHTIVDIRRIESVQRLNSVKQASTAAAQLSLVYCRDLLNDSQTRNKSVKGQETGRGLKHQAFQDINHKIPLVFCVNIFSVERV